ncbi:uncharacterized protein B0H64DRAFT_377535 [Chaetomium fimeti]|uniref:Uncharacterized protein n=1 Tax=Chaetomium fimeti TaxID=1854472 RepID=A0AAE0LNH4_9PEZI|nr:hypothetical protein B0H64DRAFT_377535 [Chaetomium fimeti]
MTLPHRDYSSVGQLEAKSMETINLKRPWTSSPAPRLTGPGRRLFRRQIAWRFLNVVLFCALLVVVLDVFGRKGPLSLTEKRGFNTLTLLFSAIVSLSLGSLLSLLGSMLRWRLLAWEKHSLRDVDLILGATSPTGSLKLIWHHATDRNARWTRTTWAVLLYLLVNVLGRFSIAALGLAYNLNEIPYTEYPVMVPDWSSKPWYHATNRTDPDYPYVPFRHHHTIRNWNAYATLALSALPADFDVDDPSSYNTRNIGGKGLDRTVNGSHVTYSYALKEYRNSEELPPTDTVLRSSASCVGRSVIGDNVYEQGKRIGTWRVNDRNVPDSKNSMSLDVTRALCLDPLKPLDLWGGINMWTVWEPDERSPGASYSPGGCSTSYFFRKEENPGSTECDPSKSCCATFYELLLSFGGLDTLLARSVTNQPAPLFYKLYIESNGGKAAAKTARTRVDFVDYLASALNITGFYNPTTPLPLPLADELHAAHLTARLPLLTVMGAEMQLPRVPKHATAHPAERHLVRIALDVKWAAVVAVMGAIVLGQAVVVGVTVACCRGVILHEHDSVLPVARLLGAVVTSSLSVKLAPPLCLRFIL